MQRGDRWTRPALLPALAAAVLLGCDTERTTEPKNAQTAPTISSAPAANLVDNHSIPIPPDNTIEKGRVGWYSTGIRIPGDAWVRIRVSGGISVSANPEYVAAYCDRPSCTPFAGHTIGPEGTLFSYLKVQVRVVAANGPAPIVLTPVEGEPYTVEGIATGAPGGGVIEVFRFGIDGSGSCSAPKPEGDPGPGPCYGGTYEHFVGAYRLGGTQTLTVQGIRPYDVEADRTRVAPGDTVAFTIDADAEVSGMRWKYIIGDTLPEPAFKLEGDFICHGLETCALAVPASGRMYAFGNVGGFGAVRASGTIHVGRPELEVQVDVARTTLSPEIPSRSFPAVCGDASYPGAPGESTTVTVRARYADGSPAADAEVVLRTVFAARSGGHDHQADDRPGFARFLPEDAVEIVGRTDENGEFSRELVAGIAGGRERVVAVVGDGESEATADRVVHIGIEGLAELAESASFVRLGATPGTLRPHPSNQWVRPAVIGNVRKLAETMQMIANTADAAGTGPLVLQLGDLSLERGGIFDADGTFDAAALDTGAYRTHREGVDVDVAWVYAEAAGSPVLPGEPGARYVARDDLERMLMAIDPDAWVVSHGENYHLRFIPCPER